MFFTIQSFTYFFWLLGGLILLMIIFEDKLLALEAKYDKKKAAKKRAKNQPKTKTTTVPMTAQRKAVSAKMQNSRSRVRGNYAA